MQHFLQFPACYFALTLLNLFAKFPYLGKTFLRNAYTLIKALQIGISYHQINLRQTDQFSQYMKYIFGKREAQKSFIPTPPNASPSSTAAKKHIYQCAVFPFAINYYNQMCCSTSDIQKNLQFSNVTLCLCVSTCPSAISDISACLQQETYLSIESFAYNCAL